MTSDLRLTPFLVLALVFFVVGKPHLDYPPETVTSALTKAAPIWFLVAYLSLVIRDARQAKKDTSYAVWIRYGLMLSSVGDVCIVWRQTLFLPGVLFFTGAHLCYIKALTSKVDMTAGETQHKIVFLVLSVISYLSALPNFESFAMAVAVLVYNAVITIMGYLSLQRHLVEKTEASLCGLVGAASFLLSDAILGFDRWTYRFFFAEMVVMVTYYAAQFFITVGSVHSSVKSTREQR
ncbi:hypothetical protein BaRGS_00015247 [Batillaria attramentaria]|uniref:lysoplasmalogenase n=1 Tax=Batillaria attramentaria TaxID=370345 RepID=A0ABD0L2S4_9CAEN|nr:hypothetical protein BaRGS_024280 [Batillaria attramentaria]